MSFMDQALESPIRAQIGQLGQEIADQFVADAQRLAAGITVTAEERGLAKRAADKVAAATILGFGAPPELKERLQKDLADAYVVLGNLEVAKRLDVETLFKQSAQQVLTRAMNSLWTFLQATLKIVQSAGGVAGTVAGVVGGVLGTGQQTPPSTGEQTPPAPQDTLPSDLDDEIDEDDDDSLPVAGEAVTGLGQAPSTGTSPGQTSAAAPSAGTPTPAGTNAAEPGGAPAVEQSGQQNSAGGDKPNVGTNPPVNQV
jgi:hypothetical protein